MNRKQKITVSITGIILVSLILIGLTYAYFLTKISGNTNSKSISVTTADLKLVYNDGSDGVIGGELIEPSDMVYTKTFTVKNEGNTNIEYGVYLIDVINQFVRKEDIKYTLDCTTDGTITCNKVTNETTFPSGISQLVTNTIEPNKTHTYTFTFTYKDTGTDQSIDMNKELSAKIQIFGKNSNNEYFPYEEGTLAYNIINNGANIQYTKVTGEFESGTCGSDLETCLKNVAAGCPGTCYKEGTEKTTTTKYISKKIKSSINIETIATGDSWNEEVQDLTNDGVFVTNDDSGNSYIYRGPIINNYINFAEMCWKIVRIQGDGSVKLILEDQDETCANTMDGDWNVKTTNGNFGYTEYAENTLTASDGTKNSNTKYLMNYLNGGTNSDKSMATAFKSFQTTLNTKIAKSYKNKTISDYLKSGDWCLDDVAYAKSNDNSTPLTAQEISDKKVKGESFYYDSYVRLVGKTSKEPTLKCNGNSMMQFGDNITPMYVGTLTADEIVYAGGNFDSPNNNYYLYNNIKKYFLTLSPSGFRNQGGFTGLSDRDYVISVDISGKIDIGSGSIVGSVSGGGFDAFRPAIQLKSDVQISKGNGTIENPYTVK